MNTGNKRECDHSAGNNKISGGYYIKARQIKYSWIAHSAPVVREVWDYLLGEANFKDVKYDGFIVKRGQLFRTFSEIREALSWRIGYRKEKYSENQMKSAMKHLREHSMIKLTKQPRGCLITIINYDIYQNPANYEATNETTNGQPTKQPPGNQWATSISKNEKNISNEKKIYSSEITDIVDSFHSYLLLSEYKDRKSVKKWDSDKQCKVIDKLNRIDGHSFKQIIEVLEFVKNDDFWRKQVQSLINLRDLSQNGNMKFENIMNAMNPVKSDKPKKLDLREI